ncbi:MAG: hypothetical protein VZQ98_16685 [Bacteroidales bacterium]|nr:hypothetical protein [Bacteroidales bacterium]
MTGTSGAGHALPIISAPPIDNRIKVISIGIDNIRSNSIRKFSEQRVSPNPCQLVTANLLTTGIEILGNNRYRQFS